MQDSSFASDVSFPEQTQDAPNPGSVRRSQRGDVSARIAERDRHELWALLRSFRQVYGEAALREVIDDSETNES